MPIMKHPLEIYRLRCGIPVTEIAEKVGVTRQSIYRIERRQQLPSLDLVQKLIVASKGNLSANDFLPINQSEAA